ncbi:hypothetical protein B0J18DRAFT_493137 [Chaetomium sp. MPI-SDFR-AT-0129]|nr:hypothetical protein B0J18DRAFT_493137 [Chaetomium sp. MPI-SDFR-AT-0129]
MILRPCFEPQGYPWPWAQKIKPINMVSLRSILLGATLLAAPIMATTLQERQGRAGTGAANGLIPELESQVQRAANERLPAQDISFKNGLRPVLNAASSAAERNRAHAFRRRRGNPRLTGA